MEQRWIDSFANKLLQFAVFFLDSRYVTLVLVSFTQNHSAITQLFYVTSLSLKLLVHDLLCSEMLQELLLH